MGSELGEIKADLKSLIEITKLVHHEQEKKNEVLFGFMNETNRTLSQVKESLVNNKEYIGSVSKDLKDHRLNHFSFLKIIGVAVGAIGGIVVLFEKAKDWGK